MNKRHRILLACMPKSGSTYLKAILSMLPSFRETSWVPGCGRREQELCRERLEADQVLFQNVNLVAQHHVRYSGVTQRYMKEFDLRPLVLVRNLYDIVPSLLDHHRNASIIYPMAYVPEGIVNWKQERAAEFVSDMVLPWYFNFYASWEDCNEKLLLSYEDLVADPEAAIARVCMEWGIAASMEEIGMAIEKAQSIQTRKNIGIEGRGKLLPEVCRRRIRHMASYYEGLGLAQFALDRHR